MKPFNTFVELALYRTEKHGNEVLYRFLESGDVTGRIEEWSYVTLDARARAIGAALADKGGRGQRVLLLYPPGLEFVAAFMGCLYGGAIAVPAYPPDPARLGRTMPRLQAIARDCDARFVMTTAAIAQMATALAPLAPGLAAMTWISTDNLDPALAATWSMPDINRDSLAFLQYTSGSTGDPKGVMLSHGNVLHNEQLIALGFGHDPSSIGAGWLPMFHDMGLIGNVLQPLFMGFPVNLMSPLAFLQRPLRWLQMISHFRATTSGGPNFAYDLCVRKATPADLDMLDLSSWSLAFNGAEPVRPETLDRFAETFGRCGFRREAFYPCYGLAEATLIATGGQKGVYPAYCSVKADSLASGQGAQAEPDDENIRTLVSSGWGLLEDIVIAVDPETRRPCADRQVGEIWVSGPAVGRGYWGREQQSAEVFGATLAGSENRQFLRTGDLGFILDGQLYVTGRLKDLIIIRGKNYYPQDIEYTVERTHNAIRPGCCAAFAVDEGGEERLVVVQEIESRDSSSPAEIAEVIREAVANEHQVPVYAVVLIRPRTIPKTSSGKIQRRACREAYRNGELEVIEQSVLQAPADMSQPALHGEAPVQLRREEFLGADPGERLRLLIEYLQARVAGVLKVRPSDMNPEHSLLSYGLDSMHSVELQQAIETDLEIGLPLADILSGKSLTALAHGLLDTIFTSARAAALPLAPIARDQELPLSFSQERLFFLYTLEPQTSAYNITVPLRWLGQLEVAALEQSITAIVRRHEALRTVFRTQNGRPIQIIHAAHERDWAAWLAVRATALDLRGLAPEEQREQRDRFMIREAQTPFVLESGPLMRVRIAHLSDSEHILIITIHHIIADGWSMGVLVHELATLYTALRNDKPASLPELPVQYVDYAAWQRQAWQLEHGDLDAYWQQKLHGAPPLLAPPTDYSRPDAQRFEGAEVSFLLPVPLQQSLLAYSREHHATLYMTLLTVWNVLLAELTGQIDLVVGTDVAGRSEKKTRDLIGLFVNQLVLRTELEGAKTFQDVLERTKNTVLDAFAHGSIPFGKLVEATSPVRNPAYNPLFQCMFVLENAPVPAVDIPGVTVQLLPMEIGGAPFDVSLLLSPSERGIDGVFRYKTALYRRDSVEEWSEEYVLVAQLVASQPTCLLSEIRQALAGAREQRQKARTAKLKETRQAKFQKIRSRE